MFSHTAEYALRAMASLALSQGELVPTVTLARKTGVPEHYLAKVLQQLSGAGLVTGRRGVHGGYRLARPVGKVSLLEVVRAVDSLERVLCCPLGATPGHKAELCPLHQMMDDAAGVVIKILDSKTLADLASESARDNPLCVGAGSSQR